MAISAIPGDILYKIFLCCDIKTARRLPEVCKAWNIFVKNREILFGTLCLGSNSKTEPLNGSWKKRWHVISNYLPEFCQQYSISLDGFFESGLKFAPLSLSFFKNTVLLINAEGSKIYQCNYLTDEILELNCTVKGAIHQIYCFNNHAAIATSEELILYNLQEQKEETRVDCPSASIRFYNEIHLVFVDKDQKFFRLLDCKTSKQKVLRTYNGQREETSVPDVYCDGKYFSQKDSSQSPLHLFGLNVIQLQNNEQAFFSTTEYMGQYALQTILDVNLLAYCTYGKIGERCSGTVFNLVGANPSGKLAKIASMKISQTRTASSFYASKSIFVVGLTGENQILAIWNYKNQAVLFECSHKINHLIVQTGRILISEDNTKFTLLDFSGTAPSTSQNCKYQVIEKPSFFMNLINSVWEKVFLARFYNLMGDIAYFHAWSQWGAIVGRIIQEIISLGFIAATAIGIASTCYMVAQAFFNRNHILKKRNSVISHA